MYDVKRIRREVEELRLKIGVENPEDVFPVWYLVRRFMLSEAQAKMQASDPAHEGNEKGYDFGLDAYHIDAKQSPARLTIIQAKFSESLNQVAAGYRDLKRAVQVVSDLLDGVEPIELRENKVIVNMRRSLSYLDPEIRNELVLDLVALHLNSDDEDTIGRRSEAARGELQMALEDEFKRRVSSIGQVGPKKMHFGEADVINVPPPPQWLTLDAVSTAAKFSAREVHMYHGMGRLAELVELYRTRGDDLFEKNVRYFLSRRSNIEHGPSGRIKETLREVCLDGQLEPEVFAFFHNGITIVTRDAELDNGRISLSDPYVLNGCQTVKTGYRFVTDPRLRDKIDQTRWRRLVVPVRVAVTRDDSLVRLITVNNNRQNAITPAALRANDQVQLDLQRRFAERNIFYERQEGHFANIESSAPDRLDDFENTRGHRVNIVELARSICAVAGGSELSHYAHHPNEIFESDAVYEKCFGAKRTGSIVFLTFLQNLHDVVPLVLKKDLGLEPADGGPRPTRFAFYALCLLVRYLAKNDESKFVEDWGQHLWRRDHELREKVATLLGNRKSKIKAALYEEFLGLEDTRVESLKSAFARVESRYRLGSNIDPFETFKDIDEEVDDCNDD